MRAVLLTSAMAGLVLSVSGCGGSNRPSTQPVSGVVTMDGKPVPGATVVFHPVDTAVGVSALGTADGGGRYTLTTYDTGDGAVAAAYKVTVSHVAGDDVSDDVDLDEVGDAYDEMMAEGDTPEGENALPAAYASPATTPEQRTVAEGVNEFNIDIKP